MGHVQDRWWKPAKDETGKPVLDSRGRPKREKTPLFGKGMRYKVRYLDLDGNEHSVSYPDGQKKEAESFLASVETDKQRGSFINPNSGKVPFRSVAKSWLDSRTFERSTHEAVESRLRNHVFPHFGDSPIKDIRPSRIQAWDRELQKQGLADTYRRVIFTHVSSVFSFAMDDELITKNPCSARSVTKPPADSTKVEPWPEETVFKIRESITARYRIAVDLGSGCGLRQGEVFGLSPDDIGDDGYITVRRQVKLIEGRPVFAPPKGGKIRRVPVANQIEKNIAKHVREFGAPEVTLRWKDPDEGEPMTVKLLVTNRNEDAVIRYPFNTDIWKPALRRAGIPKPTRRDGFHALRHFFASILLDQGENIRALSDYLGHFDPGFTLKVYTHLMPSSLERTQRAVDTVFGRH